VRGIVTHVTGEGLYVRGEGGSIFVRAASVGGLKPGTSVEAEGFAAVAPFRPILRATQVRPLGQALVPQPEPLKFLGDALARQQAELVTADVDLLAHHPGPEGGVVLQCRAGRWFFEAELPPASALSARLNDNDRLRLVGICELTSTKPLAFANTADGFRLHLRSATDVVVLRRAPWWTLRRLIWALAAAGGVALVALTWVALLRRRVAEQTRTIGAQLQRAAVKDERQRIARELHDTIEQELAGVSLQLRNARQRLAQSPAAAGTSLELAEKMLRHCRDEARTSIRDLRSVALEQRGLRGALEEFVAPLAMESAAHFTLDVQGHPRPLAGTAEIHLLRIAQEATANAVRHANASEINVRLAYDADTVTLEVRDNGCGFDPAAPAPRGHFGILGIHERANKLHAKLAIESAAGTGTVIRVIVPANTALPSPDPVL
jgi:signal transduction histidine kinase